ncbi:MAG: S26 family signal peptidase [Halobacteria archaeon]
MSREDSGNDEEEMVGELPDEEGESLGRLAEEDKNEEEEGDSWLVIVQDIVISLLIVIGIGLVLYAVSGLWPPMVAIETGSMEPHMNPGDLVFVSSPNNFVPDDANTTDGIVTYQQGKKTGYKRFGNYGDVIVYHPNGNPQRQSIIHRARKYVEEGEKYKVTNDTLKAPHAGFVTKGDNNHLYDQQQTDELSAVVKPEWIRGKAIYAIPYLGKIRLIFPVSTGQGDKVSAGETYRNNSNSTLNVAGTHAAG